ncbi:Amidohydrolase EgtC [Streptomyces lavendulae subsp. lavendulae]|uniref:Amidohydrolase EgtC n=2 Tax=Streptomyces lavendulae TaxID=1914 RepID=A0A2K8PRL0_STRLA|nr:Amidohydrolase EgtC [Streptomyces lavendulae subsp. lavendulae]QUQ58525.1 Gamma-glutamyl-hercynylcysteine sulfoxide hydrolase [Streptomyces lavendulae subsp. lavendulae]
MPRKGMVRMCRWLAYSGSPMLLDAVLYRPEHSLINQSLYARMGAEATNGDGFGIGWYSADRAGNGTPAIFRDVAPAWNNRNLRELAAHVRSPLFFAHVRASTGSAVQQTNCHPFRHGRWLWMHNGAIADFQRLQRDLCMAVDPALFPFIEGSTDSEVMFYLAVTYGLDQDVPGAVARMAGLVERLGKEHGVPEPLQMTVAVSDGERVWAFRYSSQGASRTLFYSSRADTVRHLHPEIDYLREISDETRIVVSEPLGDLHGVWNELPEASYVVVPSGPETDYLPFVPELP